MPRLLLLLLALCRAWAAASTTVAGPGPNVKGPATEPVVTLGTLELPEGFVSMGEWKRRAHLWAAKTLSDANHSRLVQVLRASDQWLGDAEAFTADARRGSGGLSGRLGSIYGTFEPLRPTLGRMWHHTPGAPPLSDKASVDRFSDVLAVLLDTAQVLTGITRGVEDVLMATSEVQALLRSSVNSQRSAASDDARRSLEAAEELLRKPDVRAHLARIRQFAASTESEVKAFKRADLAMRRLLPAVADAAEPASREAGSSASAELTERVMLKGRQLLMEHVVAAWAHMEGLAVKLCPAVATSAAAAAAFRCRVATLSEVMSEGVSFTADSLATAHRRRCDRPPEAGECPLVRLSDDIKSTHYNSTWTFGGLMLCVFGILGCVSVIFSAYSRAHSSGTPNVVAHTDFFEDEDEDRNALLNSQAGTPAARRHSSGSRGSRRSLLDAEGL